MQYLGRTPSPPLDRYIERIWYCSAPTLQARERLLPGGGTLDLLINLVEDEIRIYDPARPDAPQRYAGAVVAGSRTRGVLVDPRQRTSAVGVHFKPGGAFAFLGFSPAEIVDTHVDVGDVWGSGGRNLHEQLVEASTPGQRIRILELALLERLRRARAGHPAVGVAVAALKNGGALRVAQVAAKVGLSHRRFVELFEREVGLTPKLYARLQRFHNVKQRIATLDMAPSWASFAVECGYFDQSHMLRDFVGFSGVSPLEYLRQRAGETRMDHVSHAYPHAPAALRSA
jgi:AraC-like DNA-binding protein